MVPAYSRFPCPACGGRTHVAETRANPGGLRRRRVCVNDECGGRVTTQEVVIRVGHVGDEVKRPLMDGDFVLVSRGDLEALARISARVSESIQSQCEYALVRPDDETVVDATSQKSDDAPSVPPGSEHSSVGDSCAE